MSAGLSTYRCQFRLGSEPDVLLAPRVASVRAPHRTCLRTCPAANVAYSGRHLEARSKLIDTGYRGMHVDRWICQNPRLDFSPPGVFHLERPAASPCRAVQRQQFSTCRLGWANSRQQPADQRDPEGCGQHKDDHEHTPEPPTARHIAVLEAVCGMAAVVTHQRKKGRKPHRVQDPTSPTKR